MNSQRAVQSKIDATGAGQAQGPHPHAAPTCSPVDARETANVGPEPPIISQMTEGVGQAQSPHPHAPTTTAVDATVGSQCRRSGLCRDQHAPTTTAVDATVGTENVGPEGRGKGMGGRDAGALRLPSLPDHIPNSPIVEIKNLKKSYGLKPVLRGIDLELRQGERMALLGANGAGKTTLLRILAGLTKPDAGTVTIAGLDCVRDAQQVRKMVGLVGHQPYLYEELTALENLLFFGRMYTVQHARERALYLLQRVGLEKRMQERVSTLSRGQVQRLAWVRALLHSPRLLLLDEPDTGLDQHGSELIDALLSEHSLQGGSIVFTTHQLERALPSSDRVVILGNRRVAYQEETKALDLAALQQAYGEVGR